MPNWFLLSFALAILWCLLQNSFTPQNLVVGFLLGGLIGFLLRGTIKGGVNPRSAFSIKRWFHIMNYAIHLIKEIILANLRVARLVLTPRLKVRPGIIALPAEAKGDLQVTILGNSITLTPGTITMLVSADQKTLYIHTLDIEDPQETKKEIKESLEKYILRMGE
jgi:multicomponent Na+:H+ antiporter subunit E